MLTDRVAVQWRPRTGWEAIDLGVSLLRAYAWPAYLAWWSVWLPLSLVLAYVFREQPEWAFFLLWWCKPLAERPVVWQLGHLVFGERLPFWRLLRWSLFRLPGSLLWHLTLGRFRWSRGFVWPVWLLEEAPARIRRQRLAVLARRGMGFTRGWMLLCCWGFELMSYFSLYVLVMLLWPQDIGLEVRWWRHTSWVEHLWYAPYLFMALAMGLVGPLYLAGGFGHYLSRRCDLEGWDIELGFRRLAERLGRMGQLLLLPLLLTAALSALPLPANRAWAAAPRPEARLVEEEATRPPYQNVENTHKIRLNKDGWLYRWLNRQPQTEAESNKPPLQLPAFPALGKLLLYLALFSIVMVGALLFIRAARQGGRNTPSSEGPAEYWTTGKATADPLPSLLAQAEHLWATGQFRHALAMLYLGARRALSECHGLNLDEGDTEGELMRRAQQLPEARAAYFRRLARCWQATAYAHRLPDGAQWQQLTAGWPAFIGADQP